MQSFQAQPKIARWQSFLFAFVLSLSLLLPSGCQANSEPNSDVIKLTMWHGINPPANRDIFNSLVDKFNQTHNQIQVEALYVGQPDGQLPKILTSVVGEVPPDLLWFVPQLTGQLVELDAIRPLEDWLNQSPVKSEIDPVLFESMELNGHIWSVPFGTNNAAIFYRPSLFEKAGITKIPQTWEELREAAKKLTQDFDGDGLTDQYGMFLSLGKGEWTVFAWLPFVYSAGGELLENKQPNLVDSGTIAALQFGANLVEEGWATLSAPERGFELNNFLTGRAAMQVTGPWTLAQLRQTDTDYDVFPFPVCKKRAAVVGGENLFVFKTAPEREQAAWEFLEYVLSKEFQTEWALKTGYLPVNLEAQQSEKYQAFVQENPVLEVFLKQMNWARSRPIIPGYTRISENFGRAIEASLLDKQNPKDALQASQKRLDLLNSGDLN
ncbi:MAG: ABC transporter substrate-binding protein [Cyanobacteria bacterium SW_4_48_29]|jgi:multiple sugar transport system substrate-binding protein|nr:MAG: ABC transporter substrate-binding protein [Cyanobacteria bacterium QH_1_48_107]PSO67582.1 MAG: ABC transporter substrate-binding protein [Cyanobacteria bacterium QS_1_48_34]PSO72137.1 MAG: ABC transporter substrate-binding protein [Cyanobacteria bacterium QH_3_48_40]PSO87861.1 MAG: ABC transporter substrate-binding protein [Cyanobacteria bacterium QS_5_48_63]PSO91755.1 MAG: ABC transporter substrate-binding protein [Cyanobacteria bacterium QS_6_48_18]PSP06577.1 MAG: ABC transporter sub